jgi:hypothetical protein
MPVPHDVVPIDAAPIDAAQIEALAPDAAAAAAGKKLARPGSWKNLGQSAAALWGECQGSVEYQTRVARSDLAVKCSCPSRKLPCKHALGLLLLAASEPALLAPSAEPDWVKNWLEARTVAQERKAARARAGADKPVDVAARAKRAEKRQDNILAGLDQLDAWMNDLIRQGLARVQGESWSFWDAQARRLVDAQAPGLAARVRALGARASSSEQWAPRLLDDLGQLALLSHAARRIDQLEAKVAADVRRLIGLTLEQSEVIAHGDLIDDDWQVLAERVDQGERVSTQRAWLRGKSSGRTALVLQFSAGTQFEHALLMGTQLRARLAFWPSAAPQRALIAEQQAPAEAFRETPAGDTIPAALDRLCALLAGCPWLDATLLVLADVIPIRSAPVLVTDATGCALPLSRGDHDLLFALSGGHGLTLAGEWDGYRFLPRCAWAEGRSVVLERDV